jgi:calcium binding protein 39
MKIFQKGKKSASELVASTFKYLEVLKGSSEEKKADPTKKKKAQEKISANLEAMKIMLYGDGEHEPKKENLVKLADELLRTDLLFQLLQNIGTIDFEAQKGVAQVFNYVAKNRKPEMVEFISKKHRGVLQLLVNGYEDAIFSRLCGSMLNEVIRIEELNLILLETPSLFHPFFKYVQLTTFDVAADAFATFKNMLTKHPKQAAKFLEEHYDEVFSRYNGLLKSDSYVTKRQALKLLGELLLSRNNFKVMMRYIGALDNLKIVMPLLKEPKRTVQLEAFHVFKIFVANPHKSREVSQVLAMNKAALISFLTKFDKDAHKDKPAGEEDDSFETERKILLATLEALTFDDTSVTGAPASSSASSSSSSSSSSGSSAS